MVVTRADIARHVAAAFIGGAASRFDLLTLAQADHASPDVLRALQALPNRRFGHLFEIWEHLPGVPVAAPDGPAPAPAALAG